MPAGRPAAIINQRMLELRFGAKVVLDMFDSARSGRVDGERVEEVLNEATDLMAGMCLGAFSVSDLRDLAAVDTYVRGLCCNIAMGLASLNRPGLMTAEGGNPYTKLQEKSEAKLRDIVQAKAAARFAGEETVGRNRKLQNEVNRPTATPIFAATRNDPVGPGGF